MKNVIKIFYLLILSVSINIYGQESDFSFENLKAPSMPSATIIGTQINDINSPKSLKDLETAVFTNYLNSGESLTMPNNYALEINPFMLGGRKDFNYESYLKDEPLLNMWRNLSISVASTNNFIIKDSVSSNAMGFSLRTLIFNGKPQSKVSDAFTVAHENSSYLRQLKNDVSDFIEECIEDTSEPIIIASLSSCVISKFSRSQLLDNNQLKLSGNALTKRIIFIASAAKIIKSVFAKIDTNIARDEIADKFNDKYIEEISVPAIVELRKNLNGIKTNRFGLRWDINWAMAINFPTNTFSYSTVPRWGAWTNVSYQSEELESLSIIALAKFIINNDEYINKYQPQDGEFITGNHYDFGVKIVYELKQFSLALEYIYRLNTSKITKIIDGDEYKKTIDNNSTKYLLNVNYNLSDDINLSYNIGKDFNQISPTEGDLISGLSINFGFGSVKASELLKEK